MSGFPCGTCQAECCGPVPLTEKHMVAIAAHLSTMKPGEIRKLSRQKRGRLTCMFVDTRTMGCAIYPVRPALCRVFGRIERMVCPRLGRVENPLVQIVADMTIDKDNDGRLAMLSTDFKYETQAERKSNG